MSSRLTISTRKQPQQTTDSHTLPHLWESGGGVWECVGGCGRASSHSKPQIPTRVGIYGLLWEEALPHPPTHSHTCGNLWFRVGGLCVEPLFFFKHCLCSAKTENHPATQTESCALCERNLVVLVWRLSALGGCPHGLNGF